MVPLAAFPFQPDASTATHPRRDSIRERICRSCASPDPSFYRHTDPPAAVIRGPGRAGGRACLILIGEGAAGAVRWHSQLTNREEYQSLTPMERNCLRLAQHDRKAEQLAHILGIKASTVNTHVLSARPKLNGLPRLTAADQLRVLEARRKTGAGEVEPHTPEPSPLAAAATSPEGERCAAWGAPRCPRCQEARRTSAWNRKRTTSTFRGSAFTGRLPHAP
jgi:DNA-binding CsgD family transcriptional regulator